MKGAVIYARYSSEKQNEQSIEGQLRICNQYAEANGLTIMDTYIDRAMTGTNDHRPAFQQMLSDSEKPVPWDIVLVYAIDRFGRNSIEIAVNKQRLKKNHKTLISATQRTSENIDGTKNLDGILLENVYIGLAEYYSAELSQKIKRGLYENRSKGLFPGGHIVYGYRVVNKRVLIDEERAKIVLYVFQQYAQGVIAKDIIADLTEKGITYHGKPFAINTIYNMLRLRKYIGICNCAGTDYDNIYPPIVPTALFEEVGRILEKNKIGSKSREVEFLLKGKLICGYCGYHLQGDSGTSKSGKRIYYYKCMGRKKKNICNKRIMPKEKLEKTILDATMQVFGTPEGISAIADEILKIHEKRMHDRSVLAILTNERDVIKKSLANILKAIEQGILTATTKSRMDELEAQLSVVEDKIIVEQYKAQNQLKKEEVIEYLTHTIKQQPKLLIRNLIQKIVLYDDRFEIYFNYLNNMPPTEDNPDKTIRELSLTGCSDTSPLCLPNPCLPYAGTFFMRGERRKKERSDGLRYLRFRRHDRKHRSPLRGGAPPRRAEPDGHKTDGGRDRKHVRPFGRGHARRVRARPHRRGNANLSRHLQGTAPRPLPRPLRRAGTGVFLPARKGSENRPRYGKEHPLARHRPRTLRYAGFVLPYRNGQPRPRG